MLTELLTWRDTTPVMKIFFISVVARRGRRKGKLLPDHISHMMQARSGEELQSREIDRCREEEKERRKDKGRDTQLICQLV